jgi:hypothetical protein
VKDVTAVNQCEAKTKPSWDESVLDDPATVALLQMEMRRKPGSYEKGRN